MRTVQKVISLAAALALASSAWAAGGDGLKAREGDLTWARWQARLSLGATAPTWRSSLKETEPVGLRVGALSLSGDYYFTDALFERVNLGGLRATSGLIVGPRGHATAGQPGLGAQGSAFVAERRLLGVAAPTMVDATQDLSSVPYLSFGYTGLSLRGKWSISADLGVVALQPSNAVRLGRVFGGSQSLDDVLRDMRLAPVLQMGVSYAF
ncbi:MAG: hypothetical protein WA210_15325 [Burkholderiaceae bacterium]